MTDFFGENVSELRTSVVGYTSKTISNANNVFIIIRQYNFSYYTTSKNKICPQ